MMTHGFDMNKILEDLHTSKKKNFILDTDTYNEIDDQFAITYAMDAEDINLLALSAAPFHNCRIRTVAEAVEMSYLEMKKTRDMVDPENKLGVKCLHGAQNYMTNMFVPQQCEAAEEIVRLVKEADGIVYIAAIGCYTNLASAFLLDPTIAEKAVVILVGGQKFWRKDANDYNLGQDRCASRVLFECGVPVVLLPAGGCTEHLYAYSGEMEYYLRNKAGEIGNYLCDKFIEEEGVALRDNDECSTHYRSLWDIGAIAFLRGQEKMCGVNIENAFTITADGQWVNLNDGRKMIYVDWFDRSAVLSDFYSVVRRRPAFKNL